MVGVTWLVDFIDRLRQRREEVHVRVHRAVLIQPHEADAYFINVWNASPERDVSVTHVWIESEPPVHVLTERLPARLAPRSQWETWVEVDLLPPGTEDVEHLARVQLADDRVIRSIPRQHVPPAGGVPG